MSAPKFNPDLAKKIFQAGMDDENSARQINRRGEWAEMYRKFYDAGWEKSIEIHTPARREADRKHAELLRSIVDDFNRGMARLAEKRRQGMNF